MRLLLPSGRASLSAFGFGKRRRSSDGILCRFGREPLRASDALKARAEKTDKADARALAEMLASGWYSAVLVKSLESHQLKALLGARDQLVRVKRQLYGQVRGLLRPSGSRYLGPAPSLSMRLCEWPATRRTYSTSRSAPA